MTAFTIAVALAAVTIITFEGVVLRLRPAWRERGITALLPDMAGMAARAVAFAAGVGFVAQQPGLPRFAMVAAGAAAWLAVLVADTDIKSGRIPREPCWMVALVGAVTLLVTFPGPAAWVSLVVALVVGVVLPFVASLLMRGALGMGDVRALLAWTVACSWWAGFTGITWGIIIGCVIGAVAHFVVWVTGRGKKVDQAPEWAGGKPLRKARLSVPFGPSLAAGVIAGIVWVTMNGSTACTEWVGILSC